MKHSCWASLAVAIVSSTKASAFLPNNGIPKCSRRTEARMAAGDEDLKTDSIPRQLVALALGLTITFSGGIAHADTKTYDGFADYAKDNQMEQSDVGCFVNKCGDQTKALFSNPRGIKGVTCLGRCKGEQSCATRCFAEFGSEDLNNWLSCTIEGRSRPCLWQLQNGANTEDATYFVITLRKIMNV